MKCTKQQPGRHLGARGEWLPVATPRSREVGGVHRHILMATKTRANGTAKDEKGRQDNEESND
jgi:hypothetical protein